MPPGLVLPVKIEAVEVHDSGPIGYEVGDEFLLVVAGGVGLGQGVGETANSISQLFKSCYSSAMQVIFDIPDTLAEQLTVDGKNPASAALEALAVEGYRAHLLSEAEVRRMLGLETRMEVHALLAAHDVPLRYTEEHLRQDIQASDELAHSHSA